MNKARSVAVRTYSEVDFAALSQLVAEFYSIHRTLNGRGPMLPEEAAMMIPKNMLRTNSHILIAESTDSGKIVGFCRYEIHEGAYFLRELLVTKTWRLRGVGTALLRAAEDRVSEAGETNLYLSIVPRNSVALRFFARLGYNILNTVELRAAIPNERVVRKPIPFLDIELRY